MLKKLFFLSLLIPIGFMVVGLLLPSTYAVERSVTIAAPPQAIHALVGDLRRWPEWTPWNTARIPDLELSYEGDPTAVGGAQVWKGKSAGEGRIVIRSTDAAQGLTYEIRSLDGSMNSNGSLEYADGGGATTVTWRNSGTLGWNPLLRWFGLMADSTMGPEFERGLAGLKLKVEQPQ